MIGLDTNFLLRYLVQDDPFQSPKATAMMEGRLSAENQGFVSIVAMTETIWVLGRVHGVGRAELAEIVNRMLRSDSLVIEHEEEVAAAATVLRDGRGSFSDALIGALGASAGCMHTMTFDREASRLPGFQLAT
jgi:predicted nucleic-acid-binding protein